MQTPAFAHQSGCHRWHSCPSDHGTYTCGDTGYCSQCPDNNYCKAGNAISITTSYTSSPSSSTTPSSSSSSSSSNTTPSSSNPTSTSPPIPSTQKTSPTSTQTPACDNSLWSHVYHPQRLKILDQCKTVSGVIKSIKKEADGDFHIQLKLDSQYSSLINTANKKYQGGNLVLEPVCQNQVKQTDAISACTNFHNLLSIPAKGTHVIVTGSYVLDLEHYSWAEIHPISSIKVIG